MSTGAILVLAAVLFPVAVRVAVSVFNRIDRHTTTVSSTISAHGAARSARQ